MQHWGTVNWEPKSCRARSRMNGTMKKTMREETLVKHMGEDESMEMYAVKRKGRKRHIY